LILSGALLAWTHLIGLMIFAVGVTWTAYFRRDRRVLGAVVFAIGLAAPVVFLGIHGSRGPMGLKAPALHFSWEHSMLPFLGWLGFTKRGPFLAGVWLLPALALVGLAHALRRGARSPLLLLLFSVAPTALLCLVPTQHGFFMRYTTQSVAVVALLAGLGVDAIAEGLARRRSAFGAATRGTAAAVVVALAFAPVRDFYYERTTPLAALSQVLLKVARPGDVIQLPHERVPYFRQMIRRTLAPFIDSRFVIDNDYADKDAPGPNTWSLRWGIIEARQIGPEELLFPTESTIDRDESMLLGHGCLWSLALRPPPRWRDNPAARAVVYQEARAIYPTLETSELQTSSNPNKDRGSR
jgi:hypothetical protein